MNTKTLVLFLSLASLSGCVVKDNGPYSGNVTFTWTFGGLTCSNLPQIRSVAINIPGEVLDNNGVYPCLTSNYPGIVLHDFYPGTYNFTIQALDVTGTVLYSASGNFTIDGDVAVNVDLSPVSTTSYAYLTWSFPANSLSANPSCGQAGVNVVDVTIDQGQTQRYNCGDGQAQPGVITIPLNPGNHNIALAASNTSVGYPYYRFVGSLQTTAGSPIAAAFLLNWIGGVTVRWQISGTTCANIPTVYVNFRDPVGNFLYAGSGDPQNCTDGLAPGGAIRYDFLPPGNYSLILQASAFGGGLYTNAPYPPVTITLGYASDSQTVTSTLHL